MSSSEEGMLSTAFGDFPAHNAGWIKPLQAQAGNKRKSRIEKQNRPLSRRRSSTDISSMSTSCEDGSGIEPRKDVGKWNMRRSLSTAALSSSPAHINAGENRPAKVALTSEFLQKREESAGSLWLLLHSKTCGTGGCVVPNCAIMKKVVKHTLTCTKALGQCQAACNKANVLLRHYESVCGVEPEVKKSCPVCSLVSIVKVNDGGSGTFMKAVQARSSPILKALQPHPGSSPTGGSPFGQASEWTHEIQTKIDEKVKLLVQQEVLNHIQKKSRLRGLHEIRAQARASVLAEHQPGAGSPAFPLVGAIPVMVPLAPSPYGMVPPGMVMMPVPPFVLGGSPMFGSPHHPNSAPQSLYSTGRPDSRSRVDSTSALRSHSATNKSKSTAANVLSGESAQSSSFEQGSSSHNQSIVSSPCSVSPEVTGSTQQSSTLDKQLDNQRNICNTVASNGSGSESAFKLHSGKPEKAALKKPPVKSALSLAMIQQKSANHSQPNSTQRKTSGSTARPPQAPSSQRRARSRGPQADWRSPFGIGSPSQQLAFSFSEVSLSQSLSSPTVSSAPTTMGYHPLPGEKIAGSGTYHTSEFPAGSEFGPSRHRSHSDSNASVVGASYPSNISAVIEGGNTAESWLSQSQPINSFRVGSLGSLAENTEMHYGLENAPSGFATLDGTFNYTSVAEPHVVSDMNSYLAPTPEELIQFATNFKDAASSVDSLLKATQCIANANSVSGGQPVITPSSYISSDSQRTAHTHSGNSFTPNDFDAIHASLPFNPAQSDHSFVDDYITLETYMSTLGDDDFDVGISN